MNDLVDTSKVETLGSNAFSNCKSLQRISLLSLTSDLGTNTFYNCTSLERIDSLGTTPKTIARGQAGGYGDYGFAYGCTSLTYVDLSCITSIGDFAFNGCTSLTNINLSPTLTTIGSHAFYNCTPLSGITLPSSLTTIGVNAFNACTSLEIADLSLPNLESLASNAFVGVKITKISNLGKITTINPSNSSQANLGDKSVLKEITLPNTIKTIGNHTFNGYSALETITIESGASGISVGANAFQGLSSLVNFNVDLSAFVSLGQNAFMGIGVWDVVTFTNLTTIYHQAFRESSISKIKLPSIETMAESKNYDGIFSGCRNLVLIDIGANCTSIGSSSFGRYIGTSGKNLTVVVRAATPPSLGGTLFSTINANFSALYVPDESVDAYKAATNWSTYADIIKPLSEYVE